jgi:hypothetical protein
MAKSHRQRHRQHASALTLCHGQRLFGNAIASMTQQCHRQQGMASTSHNGLIIDINNEI